jgi:hypothetical protein
MASGHKVLAAWAVVVEMAQARGVGLALALLVVAEIWVPQVER